MLPIDPFNAIFIHVSRLAHGVEPRAWSRRGDRRAAAATRRPTRSSSPARAPVGALERVLSLTPAIHQRQAVAKMIGVCRNGRAGNCQRRRIGRRDFVERAQQSLVVAVEHVPAVLRGAVHQFAQQRRKCLRYRPYSLSPLDLRLATCLATRLATYDFRLAPSDYFSGGTPMWNRESAASGLFREKPGIRVAPELSGQIRGIANPGLQVEIARAGRAGIPRTTRNRRCR